jgi:hypothetical protein
MGIALGLDHKHTAGNIAEQLSDAQFALDADGLAVISDAQEGSATADTTVQHL